MFWDLLLIVHGSDNPCHQSAARFIMVLELCFAMQPFCIMRITEGSARDPRLGGASADPGHMNLSSQKIWVHTGLFIPRFISLLAIMNGTMVVTTEPNIYQQQSNVVPSSVLKVAKCVVCGTWEMPSSMDPFGHLNHVRTRDWAIESFKRWMWTLKPRHHCRTWESTHRCYLNQLLSWCSPPSLPQ